MKVLHSAGATCGACCCQSEGVAQCRGDRPVERVAVSLKMLHSAEVTDLWSVLLSV